jgi:hypothetical protein
MAGREQCLGEQRSVQIHHARLFRGEQTIALEAILGLGQPTRALPRAWTSMAMESSTQRT